MKMTREELKAIGLDDEQIESVMTAHGKSTNDIRQKADKVDVLQSQLDDSQNIITSRDSQLEELKKVDAESLQAEIKRLEDENSTIAQQSESRLAEELTKRDKANAIDLRIRDEGVKYPDLVKGTLSLDDVLFKDGELIGFDEALNTSKEKYADLFPKEEEEGGGAYIPGSTKKTNERKDVDDKELGRLKALERHPQAKENNEEEK